MHEKTSVKSKISEKNKNTKLMVKGNFLKNDIWVKVFKNEPSKIFGRQPLKKLKYYGLLMVCLSILDYFGLFYC